MTLDKGIIHAEDVARSNHEAAIYLVDEHPTQAEKCEECAREHEQLVIWLKELKAYREQSGDAISRQVVLEAIENDKNGRYGCFASNYDAECFKQIIRELPSVTPQQRTGQWIEHFDKTGKWYECDQCHTDWGGSVNYCPNCGAKM